MPTLLNQQSRLYACTFRMWADDGELEGRSPDSLSVSSYLSGGKGVRQGQVGR
jgi:hypothetical protein